MSARQPRRARGAGVLARVALSLYPPAWRARYGDEVRELLEDSGAGVRAAVSLAWTGGGLPSQEAAPGTARALLTDPRGP